MPLMSPVIALLASIAPVAGPLPATQAPVVRASTSVAVRIVRGARVELGRSADAEGYSVTSNVVRLEDGSARAARLIEFQ